jgi:hypothetical protein
MVDDTVITSWLTTVKNFREFKPNNLKKFSKNTYLLFFFFFKYLIFKDICIIYYKLWFSKNSYNLFINYNEHRFYFILYYILWRNKLYNFITFFIDNSIELKKENIRQDLDIFYSNNLIYLYTYLIRYMNNFFVKFNKYKFYKNIGLLNNFYFYKEFILKVEYTSFYLHQKYIEYFRISKYNEYLSNINYFEIILN